MIVIDQITYAKTGTTSGTVQHSVSSQDVFLVVMVECESGTPTSVTFNGTQMTNVVAATESTSTFSGNSSIWILYNPPVGTFTVVGTRSGSTFFNLTAISLLGVNKKTTNLISASGTAAGISGTLTTPIQIASANSLVLDNIANDSSANSPSAQSPSAPQVAFGSQNQSASNVVLGSYMYVNPGPQTTTWTWSGGSGNVGTAYTAIVLEPEDAPSIWRPNLDVRSQYDVVRRYGLDATINGGPQNQAFGYYPLQLWQNSFLHTIGRVLSPTQAAPPVTFTPDMSSLQDPFNATTLNSQRWSLFTAGGATYTTSPSGAGTVYPASTTSSTDGDITSVNTYDLTGSYAFLHVVSVASLVSSSSDNTFAVRINGSNSLQFQVEAGILYAQQIVAGSQTNLTNAPYSSSAHAWWRIRESSGTIFWETSYEGLNWATFYSTPNPINVTALIVLIAGTSFGVDTNPGSFLYNNLNVLPVGIFDEFNFQPAKPTFYSSEFWYSVGRVISQPNSPIRVSPTVSVSSGTTLVSGTFTPPANATILISVGMACSVSQVLSISDTIGDLVWTQVNNTPSKGGTAVFNMSAIFYAEAPSTPTAGTVTITSSQTITNAQAEYFYLNGYGVVGATGVTNAATVSTVAVILSGAPAPSSLIFATTQYRVANNAPVITQPPGFTPFALVGANPEFEQSSYQTGNGVQTISSWSYSPSNTEGAVAIEITTNLASPAAETELETSQIIIDRVTQTAQISATSATVDHVVSSQDAVMLIFASQMGVAQAFTSVNLNNAPLTALNKSSLSTLTSGAYFIVNPNVGVNTVSLSVSLPTAIEIVAISLLGVDKKTLNPINIANAIALGSPLATINPTAANSLLIDYVGSLDTTGASSYNSTVIGDSPTSFWELDDSSGTVAVDTMGVTNGSYINSPTLSQSTLITSGISSVHFTAAASQDLTMLAPLNGTNGTWEFWFQWTTGTSLMRDDTGTGGWILGLSNSGTFAVRIAGTTFNTTLPMTVVQNGLTHHFCLVKTGGIATLYLDNQSVMSTLVAPNTAPVTKWHFGRNGNIAGQYSDATFDEIAIYPSALTPTQVSAHYAAGTTDTRPFANSSQTQYFYQPQSNSSAFGSIKLSNVGTQTMSWSTSSVASIQLIVALEPANAPSIWFPTIDDRNLSDVIEANALDAKINPQGAFYATYGTHPAQFYQNSFLHTVGRYTQPTTVVVTQQPLELQLLGMG